jgi:hypothetical protein
MLGMLGIDEGIEVAMASAVDGMEVAMASAVDAKFCTCDTGDEIRLHAKLNVRSADNRMNLESRDIISLLGRLTS